MISMDAWPPMKDASELLAQNLAMPDELVYGLLHQGSTLAIGGCMKCYKSWALLDLAVSVSRGEPWLSLKTVRTPVLYVDFDLQKACLDDRIRAIEREKGIKDDPDTLALWNLNGYCVNYATFLPRILREAKDRFGLIILDPLCALLGSADERDVAHLLNAVEALAIQTKAAIVFDSIFMTGYDAFSPDSILTLTRHETDDVFTIEAMLRNHPPLAPFVVRWQYPLLRRDESLDPARLKKRIKRKAGKRITKLNDAQKWIQTPLGPEGPKGP